MRRIWNRRNRPRRRRNDLTRHLLIEGAILAALFLLSLVFSPPPEPRALLLWLIDGIKRLNR